MLVSQETGVCEAIIHGQIPTRIRTAAASAVATRHLARPDSQVLGLIGAGDLAVEHVHAILQVRPIDRVLVWSRTPATASRFIERIGRDFPSLKVESADSPREVVEASDVVCTLTPSREPVVEAPGSSRACTSTPSAHRLVRITARSIPPGWRRARVFVDSMGTAMHNSGDLLLAIADGSISEAQVVAELGDVIAGTAVGSTSADEITLYNSVGIAMQDMAIGSVLVEKARAAGVGREIDLGA